MEVTGTAMSEGEKQQQMLQGFLCGKDHAFAPCQAHVVVGCGIVVTGSGHHTGYGYSGLSLRELGKLTNLRCYHRGDK